MTHKSSKYLYAFFVSLALYNVGAMVIIASIDVGCLLMSSTDRPQQDGFAATMKMDARNYQRIVDQGYSFQSDKRSMAAFFPFFPKLCSIFIALFGWRSDLCMLFIANLAFYFTIVNLQLRDPDLNSLSCNWTVVIFCFFPSTFFFHMGYSESMFCLLLALVLFGMQNQWPIWIIASLAGLASGTRPVGIAVSAGVWWYVMFTSSRQRCQNNNDAPHRDGIIWRRIATMLWVIPLSSSGLLLYMGYLWWAFDAPLAFAQTQEHWKFLSPKDYTFFDKVWSLLSLEPIWNNYNSDSPRYWRHGDTQSNPLLSCQFWNPIFYLFAWVLIGVGYWKRWLKDYEIILSIGLLLIPYVTRAYEMSMASHARFAAVVIPQYFVLGRLFAMMPPAVAGCLCGLMGLMLGLWTALFVAGYRFF